jgi:hypothetical protein
VADKEALSSIIGVDKPAGNIAKGEFITGFSITISLVMLSFFRKLSKV